MVSLRSVSVGLVAALLVAACATSPTGRRQLNLFPQGQMQAMGVQAFQQIKEETPTLSGGPVVSYVQCVADAITAQVNSASAPQGWEVQVFRSDQVNAFALPGGKIGVYTGLLKVAENQHQLAAVVGHEVGHVLADHSNERLSTNYAAQTGVTLLSVLAGASGAMDRNTAMGLLGLGAQVGVVLPFSRLHESEADRIGLDLMAEAGFDPRESVDLWRNMARAGGKGPPEFLSTHPSRQTRINDLQGWMPQAIDRYEVAQARGRSPNCPRPAEIPSGQ